MSDAFSVLPLSPDPTCLDCVVMLRAAQDYVNWVPLARDQMPCTITGIYASLDTRGRPVTSINIRFPDVATKDRFLSKPGEGRMQVW
jgi:hypothetical protein